MFQRRVSCCDQAAVQAALRNLVGTAAIERHSQFLRNIVRILTETGLRINKELLPMRKDQLDIANATVWIPDSKTEHGVAEVPLTPIAVDAFRNQLSLAGPGDWLFPSSRTSQHCKSVKRIWRTALRKAEISYFRIYDLRSTHATRLSSGGVADQWVVQLLRQGNSDVFKKYSQMKLAMKREALEKLNRRANEMTVGLAQAALQTGVLVQFWYSDDRKAKERILESAEML